LKPNLVRFTGKFTDLIPNGWKFYQDGCKVYSKGRPYEKCRIYPRGKRLEIDRLNNSESTALVNLIEENKIEECKIHLPSGAQSYWLYSDHKENRVIPYKVPEFNAIQQITNPLINPEITPEKRDRYQLHYLKPPLIELLQDLINKGWIKTVYDEKLTKNS
jgi:hypothetical protein